MNIFKIFASLAILLSICACKVTKSSTAENTVMNDIKHKITVGGKDWQNPIPYTPDVAKEGQEHFQHHCGVCHGLDGQNTGVPFAEKMSPPVADLASAEIQKYSDGQLKWIIQNGIEPSGMPGWKGTLDDDEMWKVVDYIRHLPAKGSLGAPQIYKESEEEHGQMEHHNGKAQPHQHKH